MNVDGLDPLSQASSLTRAEGTDRSSAQASHAGGAGGADEARLLWDESKIQSLASQVNGQPEIRQDRVNALQQAIQGGRYTVSDEQIANALFAEHLG